MTDEEEKEFKQIVRKESNDMLMREIEAHYAFIKQILTICIAGIGFMGVLIRAEGITHNEARIIQSIIILLSLCILCCVIYLSSHKRIFAEIRRLIREHANKSIYENTPTRNTVFAKIGTFYVAVELLIRIFFFSAVGVLILYSLGLTELNLCLT